MADSSRLLNELPGDLLELKTVLDEAYVTPQQVGDLLGAKPNTVLHWLRDGKLIGKRVGGRWRIYPEQLRDFLKLEGYQDILDKAEAAALAKEAKDGT